MKYTIILCCAIAMVPGLALGAKPQPTKPQVAKKRSDPKPAAEPTKVELKGGETPQQIQAAYARAMSELMPDLDERDQAAFAKFDMLVLSSGRPGAENERAACCRALVALVEEQAASQRNAFYLRELSMLGRAESVPVESKLLAGHDAIMRETARRALEHNPAPEAAESLRAALAETTEPAWQVALALSLGARKDAHAVPALARLLAQKDEKVVEAACSALGDIGNSEAADALARASVPKRLRLTAAEAHLKCAEQLPARSAAAAAIYRHYLKPEWPRGVRLAALAGLLRSSGDDAGRMVLDILAGDNADARAVAAGLINELSGPALKTIAAGFEKLPMDRRLGVLTVLAGRGEKSALPAALAAMKSDNPEVRSVGLAAVGELGDASVVPLLVEQMFAGGPGADVARESLLRLSAPGVNASLIAILKGQKKADSRNALIDVADRRGAVELAPVLLADLPSTDIGVRRKAFYVLSKLALPVHIPALLPAVVRSKAGSEREEAEQALTAVCNRIVPPQQQADPILIAYRKAAPADKAVLLSVMGRIGGPQAFAAIKAAMVDADPTVCDAGIRGLCNWPDITAAKDLLELVATAREPAQRALALRALVRVATIKDGAPEKEQLRYVTRAMELAQRDDDRNYILHRSSVIRRYETFRLILPYVNKPALCTAASRTLVELAHHGGLKSNHKAEYVAALNKVMELCKDKGVVAAAKKELQE